MRVPRTLHLLVRRGGGGTETNVNRLCGAVPEFNAVALEDWLGAGLSPWKIPAAVAALRRLNPEVVFCYGVTAHMVASLAWIWGKPLVGNIRCESDFDGWKGLWKRCLGWRFRVWLSNSRMALRGARGHVIYNGIDRPSPEVPQFPTLARPVLGILASGHPKKGHRFALELWRKLGKPGAMVFGGNLGEDLKREAEQQGALCPGFVKPGPFLLSLDLLIVPSTAEGIPTVILEAMARGIPSLATPVGGIPEIIRHGDNGFLLSREKWEEFLRTTSRDQWHAIGQRAREDVRRRHPFEKQRRRFRAAAWLAMRRRSLY
jgi:glycosyltransferase involved in cell wall biosynthesis